MSDKIKPKVLDRLDRIERMFLSFAALITGEAKAADIGDGGFEAMQEQFGQDMTDIKDEQ